MLVLEYTVVFLLVVCRCLLLLWDVVGLLSGAFLLLVLVAGACSVRLGLLGYGFAPCELVVCCIRSLLVFDFGAGLSWGCGSWVLVAWLACPLSCFGSLVYSCVVEVVWAVAWGWLDELSPGWAWAFVSGLLVVFLGLLLFFSGVLWFRIS